MSVERCRLLTCLANFDERWGEAGQQDAQEFLHSLLEALRLDMAGGQGRLLEPRRSSIEMSETQQVPPLSFYAGRKLHFAITNSLGMMRCCLQLTLPLARAPGNMTSTCSNLFCANKICLIFFVFRQHACALETFTNTCTLLFDSVMCAAMMFCRQQMHGGGSSWCTRRLWTRPLGGCCSPRCAARCVARAATATSTSWTSAYRCRPAKTRRSRSGAPHCGRGIPWLLYVAHECRQPWVDEKIACQVMASGC